MINEGKKTEREEMNGEATTPNTQSNLSIFLFGAILNVLAALDYVSMVDYSIKAILGGIIWLAFKVAGDYLGERFENKKRKEKK